MNNPFRYGEIVTGEDFADRQKELVSLVSDLQGSARIFLVSPRRYGKSSLLINVLEKLKKKGFLTAYIDLYKTPSLKSFIDMYATVLASSGRSKVNEMVNLIKEIIPSLRPKIILESPEGPSFSFDIGVGTPDVQRQLRDIFDLPERIAKKRKKRVVVVIDEFQEISNLGGLSMEKELRAVIQLHSNVSYVFAGSKRELLLDMVQQQNRAFYQMGKVVMLEKIPREYFAPFLKEKFIQSGYRISDETITSLLDFVEDFPYNAQFFCHELWEIHREKKEIERHDLDSTLNLILGNHAPMFLSMWDSLSLIQRRTLLALAKEKSEGLFSQERIQRYDLGSAASTQTAMKGLHNKGIVERSNGNYFFNDVFFKHWISRFIKA